MKTHGHYAAYTNVEEQNVKFLKKRTLKWFISSKKLKEDFVGSAEQVYFLSS